MVTASPAHSVPDHTKAAALLSNQRQVFENYKNARIQSQGVSALSKDSGFQ